jgi:hypothetical protein
LRGDENKLQQRKIVHDREHRETDMDVFFSELRGNFFRGLVNIYTSLMAPRSLGRPREHAPATLAALHLLMHMDFADSERRAVDMFKFESFREEVFNVLRAEFPDQYKLAPSRVPSRFAYQRVKRRIGAAEAQLICDNFRTEADSAAREMGLGVNQGTRHAPTQESIVYADATWLRSMTRFTANDYAIDSATGEIRQRRHDPEAIEYRRPTTARKGDAAEQDRGNQIAMFSARLPYAYEEITLDCRPIRLTSELNEAQTALLALKEIKSRHPGVEILAYDKAITGDIVNDFRHLGVEVLNAVPDKSRYSTRLSYVGKTVVDGLKVTLLTYESAMCIAGTDGKPVKLLELVARDLHPRADGTFRTYGDFRIPSNSNCDVRLWGKIVTARIDMPTTRDRNPKKSKVTNLGDHLRLFPPGSRYFEANRGIRSNSEALNSLVKRYSGPGRRMKSLRFAHQWIDVLTTLAVKNRRAVMQHRSRLQRELALAPPA